MEIIVAKHAGFCFGVENAVSKTKQILENEKDVYCLGKLVHNRQVVSELENAGLNIKEEINDIPNNSIAIIRAHGTTQDTYKKASLNKIKLVDLTCPKVLKIHDTIKEYVNKDFYIFLIAVKNHPETIGTYSFCGNNKSIIEELEDVEIAVEAFKRSGKKDLLIMCQTTFSSEKFDTIVENISNLLEGINIVVKKTICNATESRQKETEEISKQVELMIVIGGHNSSNTKKLYEVAQKHCQNAILVEDIKNIDIEYIKQFSKIGITSGASTPKESMNIEEVIYGYSK